MTLTDAFSRTEDKSRGKSNFSLKKVYHSGRLLSKACARIGPNDGRLSLWQRWTKKGTDIANIGPHVTAAKMAAVGQSDSVVGTYGALYPWNSYGIEFADCYLVQNGIVT